MDQETEEQPVYTHIIQNDFSYRKHKKQKEEDIAICVCKFDATNPDNACGDRCLNSLTSTECTSGYCPCGDHCKNQKFQKCDYAKTKLVKTGGCGWGLIADENIKAGRFIIEYCGEVISSKEAERRFQAYEIQGLRDAYIITLDAHESIDATRKGSLGRFINHSCQPNCETRKWTVLGEIRVGIFAKQDIPVGTELAYDYNFEWYGGAKVRCLCGAASCSGFLGAKSRGFLEDTYVWEDDDERYSVEKVPLYDSAEDEPSFKFTDNMDAPKHEFHNNGENSYSIMNMSVRVAAESESMDLVVKPHEPAPGDGMDIDAVKAEVPGEEKQSFSQSNAIISHIQSNSAGQNYQITPGKLLKKKSKKPRIGKLKFLAQKQVDAKFVAQLLASKEAQQEVFRYEDIKNYATSELDSLYNEIRPAIEEHERDTQDSVPTSVAEKWIEASCSKLKAEFDFYSSIIKNVASNPAGRRAQAKLLEDNNENEIKFLTN